MARETVKLTGMRELERNLAQLPRAVARRNALKALRDGGEPMAQMARSLAPVDEGYLRESISVAASLATSQRGDRGAVAPVEMYVGPGQHPQAITQEFGTFKEPAQPFMRPAWNSTRYQVLDRIGALLWAYVERAIVRQRSG